MASIMVRTHKAGDQSPTWPNSVVSIEFLFLLQLSICSVPVCSKTRSMSVYCRWSEISTPSEVSFWRKYEPITHNWKYVSRFWKVTPPPPNYNDVPKPSKEEQWQDDALGHRVSSYHCSVMVRFQHLVALILSNWNLLHGYNFLIAKAIYIITFGGVDAHVSVLYHGSMVGRQAAAGSFVETCSETDTCSLNLMEQKQETYAICTDFGDISTADFVSGLLLIWAKPSILNLFCQIILASHLLLDIPYHVAVAEMKKEPMYKRERNVWGSIALKGLRAKDAAVRFLCPCQLQNKSTKE